MINSLPIFKQKVAFRKHPQIQIILQDNNDIAVTAMTSLQGMKAQ